MRHTLSPDAYARRRETLLNVYYRWNRMYCDFIERYGRDASCSRQAFNMIDETLMEIVALQNEQVLVALNGGGF